MLLSEHHQEIEYDLLTLPGGGIDLLDFWRGTLSPRRLILILRHLPPDSHLGRAINPDGATTASWRTGDYLMAHLIDMYARVNFKDPKPFTRPADVIDAERKRQARHAALERQALRLRAVVTN